ncbi:SDR family NAD(P)-dependent oxidoreductase, partial [Burkholderia sola]|uniref:SDR family NAD(P)-dependent oxidoreductase n=1 Tax=Burkholderia sola TaxID=2843302 RepID=UPI0023DDF3AA
MSNLNGKTAVVTGAASGIGKEIALELAKAGAAVAIADLNQDGANAVADEIVKAGGKAIGVAMDVTNEDAVNSGIDKVAEAFGSVDILVSNAGIQIVNPIENGGAYIFLAFSLVYGKYLGIPNGTMLTGVMIAMIVEMGAMLAWGRLSDRIGRKPVYLIGALSLVACAFPFFWLLDTRVTPLVWLALTVGTAVSH